MKKDINPAAAPGIKEDQELIFQKLIHASEEFIQFQGGTPDYAKILQIMLDISGAKYAALNIFDHNELGFRTVALAGVKENIEAEAFVVRIVKDSKTLGDFTLLFKKGETLINNSFVDLYAHQTGLFLDRNKSINSLLMSESRFRQVVLQSECVVWEVDAVGLYTYLSPLALKIYGYTPEQLVGKKHFYDLYPRDKCDEFKKAALEVFRQKGSFHNLINLISRPDGSIKILSTNGIPIMDENGTLIGYRGIDSDITDRKRADDLLQQTRNNYETFFNTIDEFLFVLDEQGNIIHTNTTVIYRLGYTREELAGLSVLMLHPAERRDEAGRIVGEMLSGLTEFCPVPLVTKFGVQIPVETRVSLGLWDGKPVIFGVTKDISKVRLSEEKFSKVFYLNPSACGLSGLDDGKYYEVNEAFYNLFGFDKDEVIGKTPAELGIINTESKTAILKKADSNGNVTNAEADLIAKNGDIKHVLLSSENILVQDRKYRFTVVHDITLQKQTEKVLRESEEKHRQLIENSHDIIYTLTADGIFIFVSHAWTTLLGHPVKQVEGQPFQQFVHPDDLPGCLVFLQKVIETGQRQVGVEYRVRHIDGTWYWHTSSAVPLRDNNGKVIGFEGTARDITDRKQIEAVIRHTNEELLTVNAEKDKFFSIIAHDLRSPFNVFLGFTQILVEELNTMSLEEIKPIAVSMQKSAISLYSLLENLLEWSMMQRGLITYNPVSIPLSLKIKESIEFFIESLNKKGVIISCNIPENLSVFADLHMLESMLRNLISNAVKFTSKKGRITVSANKIKGNFIEIAVNDTGIGMNKELMSKLFKLDEHTGRKGTEGEASTGLGLIICKEFIEKHGSTICVESEEGKGSTFCFTLPLNI